MSVYYLQPAAAAAPRAVQPHTHHMSQRQTEVLGLLGEGLSNKLIGRALGISDLTVKQHIQCVLEELGAANRLQAVVFAYRRGILSLDGEQALPAAPDSSPKASAPRGSRVIAGA